MNIKNAILNQKVLLSFFVISLWMSVDTSFYNFQSFKLNFKTLFIYVRIIAPYIICSICLFLFLIDRYKSKEKSSINYFFYFTYLYLLSQIIGLILTNNSILNISFLINSAFLILLIQISYFYKININKYFNLSILILFFVLVIYSYGMLKWFFIETVNLNLYGAWPHSLREYEFLSSNLPRSSGLARNAMILFIFSSFVIFIKNKNNLLMYSLVFIYLSLIILLTQSRIILIFYFGFSTILIISIIISKLFNFKKKILIIFIIFILPILFTLFSVKFKNSYVIYKCCSMDYYTYGELHDDTSNLIAENWEITETSDILHLKKYNLRISEEFVGEAAGGEDIIRNDFINKNKKVWRPVDPRSFSSFRFEDWNKLIKQNKSIFYGYGTMGDRFLIGQTASNGFIYAYSSSGIIGVILFTIIFVRSAYLSTKIIFKSKFQIKKENYKYLVSSSLIIFFLFRSIVETSFANFGIDFLLFFISMSYLEYNKKILNE